MCDTRCRFEASKISWPSAGSTLATKPCGSGGTGLVRCSPPRFASDGLRTCAAIRSGADGVDALLTASQCAKAAMFVASHATERASMKKASIIGLDLAKRSFQAHGALADGSVAFRKKLTR